MTRDRGAGVEYRSQRPTVDVGSANQCNLEPGSLASAHDGREDEHADALPYSSNGGPGVGCQSLHSPRRSVRSRQTNSRQGANQRRGCRSFQPTASDRLRDVKRSKRQSRLCLLRCGAHGLPVPSVGAGRNAMVNPRLRVALLGRISSLNLGRASDLGCIPSPKLGPLFVRVVSH